MPRRSTNVTRREWLGFLGLSALTQGQEIHFREYARCLPDHLSGIARAAYDKRVKALAAIRTPAAFRQRQQWTRETFWRLAGGMPERTPLNIRTTGSFAREGYTVEKLIYESQPGLLIPANLYIPSAGQPPFPGVLFQMGHSLNGKANSGYQKCCQALARLGYLVLAFDPMGQGERTYYPASGGTLTRLDSADREHTLPGEQMLLVGVTSTRMQTWDAVRSLDVLTAHPKVDPKRLASTGQSGGGTLTMMLAAVDERLSCAAVSCGNTENFACDGFLPPGSVDDAEQDLIGSGLEGFDRWDLLYPMAPKPLLVLASARDYFGTYSPRYLLSGREEFARLGQFYKLLGAEDRLAWGETPLPHGLAYALRLRIYQWFEKHLKGSDRSIDEEPTVAPEPDQVLWAAPKGLTIAMGSQSPRSLLRVPPAMQSKPLAALIGVAAPANGAWRTMSTVPHGRVKVEAFEVQSAPSVWVPGYLFLPPARSNRVLLILDDRGRSAAWQEDTLFPELAATGLAVCAIDVRGHGDLRPQPSPGPPGYSLSHATDVSYAWASLILGQPLLGQRVTDVIAVVRALKTRFPEGVALAARGRLSVTGLCSAAIEQDVAQLMISGGLASFRSVIETEEPKYSFADLVPSLLHHTDLGQIAASLAPRPLLVAGLVDASARGLGQSPWSGSHITYQKEPAWNIDFLRRWS